MLRKCCRRECASIPLARYLQNIQDMFQFTWNLLSMFPSGFERDCPPLRWWLFVTVSETWLLSTFWNRKIEIGLCFGEMQRVHGVIRWRPVVRLGFQTLTLTWHLANWSCAILLLFLTFYRHYMLIRGSHCGCFARNGWCSLFIMSPVCVLDVWTGYDISINRLFRAPGSVSVDGVVPRYANWVFVPVFLGKDPVSSLCINIVKARTVSYDTTLGCL